MKPPWYRELTRDQWNAFLGTFLGWVLDGFDFTILTFILIDIQHSFAVDKVLAGALGTVTLITRLVGGVLAGSAADRWGRRGPLMVSILWFSLFACLSGFSTSYAMLFGIRALFGIGMGGEWAAGMPLTLEHWPPHLRGIASGLLQAGFSWGFMLAAFAFHYVYPLFKDQPDLGWRVMFWLGALPALLVLWIRTKVPESPVWLERQRHLRDTQQTDGLSVVRIFRPDLLPTTIQTAVLMASFMLSYYSITFWYPTLLRGAGADPLPYLVALNLGAIVGGAVWGRLSDGALGRRGAVVAASFIGVLVVPLYVFTADPVMRLIGAVSMGFGGIGIWGMVPTCLTERFPTAARGVGPGFVYHAGAGIGSLTPTLIGALQEQGISLAAAMGGLIALSGVLAALLMWLGPETRGSRFVAFDAGPSVQQDAAV